MKNALAGLVKKTFTILLAGFIIFSPACKSAETTKDNHSSSVIDGDEPIPRKYKSIYFHNFINDSYTGELTGEIYEILLQKMSLQQRFKIEPEKDKADVWLFGKVEYYKLIPRNIDQFGRILQYNMTIVVSVWLSPGSKFEQEDIFEKQTVRFDTFYSPEQPPYDTEFSARQRLIDGLCDRIIRAIMTGWYSDLKTKKELGYDPASRKNLLGP